MQFLALNHNTTKQKRSFPSLLKVCWMLWFNATKSAIDALRTVHILSSCRWKNWNNRRCVTILFNHFILKRLNKLLLTNCFLSIIGYYFRINCFNINAISGIKLLFSCTFFLIIHYQWMDFNNLFDTKWIPLKISYLNQPQNAADFGNTLNEHHHYLYS